eukprot:scaffold63430_cov24-Attheya_sp.AAC.1
MNVTTTIANETTTMIANEMEGTRRRQGPNLPPSISFGSGGDAEEEAVSSWAEWAANEARDKGVLPNTSPQGVERFFDDLLPTIEETEAINGSDDDGANATNVSTVETLEATRLQVEAQELQQEEMQVSTSSLSSSGARFADDINRKA